MEKEKMVSMVLAVQNGENDAMTELYDAFYNDIYYYILKTVNDSELALDLTQDAFIEIFQTIGSLREPVAFVNWSKKIAYHRCTAYFRKKRDLLLDEDEEGQSVFDTIVEEREEFIPDEALDKDELKKTIHEMIDSLPEEQKTAIMMRYFDEMSVKEIADIQGVTEGTVKSRLNYGRKAIKQSVEDYEKKNGVKLRCSGVVPLLLWLFREYRVANGASFAGNMASVAAQTETVVKTSLQTGRKVMSVFTKKLIAGITTAAVVTGGVVTGIMLQPKESSLEWCGYGEAFYDSLSERRFEISVEDMDDKSINGHLEVSNLYDVLHDSDFKGNVASKDDDTIRYNLVFESPASNNILGVLEYEYENIIITYDKNSENFILDDFYKVVLKRENTEEIMVAKNKSWSGKGKDSLCNSQQLDHLFVLDVDEMTETDVSGKLLVKKENSIEHESQFTGRGFKKNNILHFEIKLENPRVEEALGVTFSVDNFWMQYDCVKNEFEIPSPCHYKVVMKQK